MQKLQKLKIFAVSLLMLCTGIACKQSYDIHRTQIIFKNLPFVKATVNGIDGYLLIDTGSSRTMLIKSLSDCLCVKVDSST